MKKQKTITPFHFDGLSNQDMVDLLNNEYPINIKYNEDLINRICIKYPTLNKVEISIIVKSVFQSFRDLLILGKVLNFNNLLFDGKLLFYNFNINGNIFPSLRVKISTPPPLRIYDK